MPSPRLFRLRLSAALSAGLAATPALADFVIANDDLIVDGSICAGFDCVDGEVFEQDTLRLHENNLRIHFDDTSAAGPPHFPRNDWRIVINELIEDGPSFFRVEDVTGGLMPFTLMAGAPSHALYVDSVGEVGLGTNNPVVELHIKSGNIPTLRLEQDGTGGFKPRTWDIAGNETNFFVRDVTAGGSTRPFVIRTDAPSDSLYIDEAGNVGIGTDNPAAPLEIRDTGTFSFFRLTAAGAPTAKSADITFTQGSYPHTGEFRYNIVDGDGPEMRLTVNGLMYLRDGAAHAASWPGGLASEWDMHFYSGQETFFDRDSPSMILYEYGNLQLPYGGLIQNSDRNAKTAVDPVDPAAILARVAALEISEWSYRTQADAGVRHIGPMAQDFHALFGTGASETGISTLDTSGVALAAIQALAAENAALKGHVATLSARLDRLEAAGD